MRNETEAEKASERRRRFQLFADHGVPVKDNPYTPAYYDVNYYELGL